jgi:hypothetical protein
VALLLSLAAELLPWLGAALLQLVGVAAQRCAAALQGEGQGRLLHGAGPHCCCFSPSPCSARRWGSSSAWGICKCECGWSVRDHCEKEDLQNTVYVRQIQICL